MYGDKTSKIANIANNKFYKAGGSTWYDIICDTVLTEMNERKDDGWGVSEIIRVILMPVSIVCLYCFILLLWFRYRTVATRVARTRLEAPCRSLLDLNTV